MYCIPYLKSSHPAIILSCVVPGNPYPVTESKDQPTSLNGQPLKGGYQSHYVLTQRDGFPCPKIVESGYFDEIVIDQEGSVVPMYVAAIDTKNFPQLLRDYQRDMKADKDNNDAADSSDAENTPFVLPKEPEQKQEEKDAENTPFVLPKEPEQKQEEDDYFALEIMSPDAH